MSTENFPFLSFSPTRESKSSVMKNWRVLRGEEDYVVIALLPNFYKLDNIIILQKLATDLPVTFQIPEMNFPILTARNKMTCINKSTLKQKAIICMPLQKFFLLPTTDVIECMCTVEAWIHNIISVLRELTKGKRRYLRKQFGWDAFLRHEIPKSKVPINWCWSKAAGIFGNIYACYVTTMGYNAAIWFEDSSIPKHDCLVVGSANKNISEFVCFNTSDYIRVTVEDCLYRFRFFNICDFD